jgi:transposase
MERRVLRNDQYRRIETLSPGKKEYPGRTAADNQYFLEYFLEAVLWIARTGSPWRDLPEWFGRWNSVYQRFARWYKKGVWQQIFEILAQDADFEEVFIDSTVMRVHQHAADAPREKGGQALGRSRGGLSTKIHALVEGLGIMARFRLTPGQAGDNPQALPLLEGITPGPADGDVLLPA